MIVLILQIVSVGFVLAYAGCMVIMVAWAGVLTYCGDWSTSPGVHIYMLEQDNRIRRDL